MLILDFDGTITDAEREGAPYRAGYYRDLAILTGLPGADIGARAEQIEAEIHAHPARYGWCLRGAVVAPAQVDPYLRSMAVAGILFDQCGLFGNPNERERLFSLLYEHNYQHTDNVFRSGAYEFLATLTKRTVHVVTNSSTAPVQAKLRALARELGEFDRLIERVHGRARKYEIDPSFELPGLSESLILDGLDRPVLLRRRHYYDVLRACLADVGEDFSQLLVVGDIFELDLALPLALGARVALMVNQFTPKYEVSYLSAHPRGQVIRALSELDLG